MIMPDVDSLEGGGPDWREPQSLPALERPLHWDWLVETGSLTERIATDLGSPLHVKLISERREPEDGALVREVRLHVRHRPVVYALSRIPEPLLQELPWLAELGEQPMGERLFEIPGTYRERLRLAQLAPDEPLVRSAFDGLDENPRGIWARVSRLVMRDSPITITECFLCGDPG